VTGGRHHAWSMVDTTGLDAALESKTSLAGFSPS